MLNDGRIEPALSLETFQATQFESVKGFHRCNSTPTGKTAANETGSLLLDIQSTPATNYTTNRAVHTYACAICLPTYLATSFLRGGKPHIFENMFWY